MIWLGGAMAVFLAASASLRQHVDDARMVTLVGALILYTLGNLMMLRLMREAGMTTAISLSAVLQLVLAAGVGLIVFHERPAPLQLAGIALGVVSVGLILWSTGGAR